MDFFSGSLNQTKCDSLSNKCKHKHKNFEIQNMCVCVSIETYCTYRNVHISGNKRVKEL